MATTFMPAAKGSARTPLGSICVHQGALGLTLQIFRCFLGREIDLECLLTLLVQVTLFFILNGVGAMILKTT